MRITARMKRRSIAIGCSIASRSSAIWSISRSRRLIAGSECSTSSQMLRSRVRYASIDRWIACSAIPAITSKLLLQFVQALVKLHTHQPNLPVM